MIFSGEGKDRGREQTTICKINKLQEYIVQHREYIQYSIITKDGTQSLKIFSHCVVYLKFML